MKSAKLRWKGARATKDWDSAYGVGQSMELASMCLWWSRDHPLRERGSELETRSCKSITWCLTESLTERQSRWCVISVLVCEWTCVFGSVLNISHREKSFVDLLSLKLFTDKMKDIFWLVHQNSELMKTHRKPIGTLSKKYFFYCKKSETGKETLSKPIIRDIFWCTCMRLLVLYGFFMDIIMEKLSQWKPNWTYWINKERPYVYQLNV